MNLESEKDSARRRVEVFLSRYADHDASFAPLRLARAWLDELMKTEFDPLALVQIRDEAKGIQNRFDIAFFTFCNHIDGVVKELTRPIGA